MADYWSLVIFTILGQSAVGLMALLALCRREKRSAVRRTWIAILALVAATAVSLGHLTDPMISYFAITNIMHSWLSREILFAGLFGAVMLAWVILRVEWLRWLAALVGLAFVYVMSRVYLIPAEPLWDSPFTFWNFLTTAFLLGATLLLILDELAARCEVTAMRRLLLSRMPVLIALLMGLRIIFMLAQLNRSGMTTDGGDPWLEFLQTGLLIAGGGLGLLLLAHRAAKLPAITPEIKTVFVEKTEEANTPDASPKPPKNAQTAPVPCHACGLFFGSVLVVALIWAGEICGRVLFYQAYIWFGM